MNPASMEYLNRQQMLPKLRWWTLGANVDLGFAAATDFYVYLSLVFSACYHWWISFLDWLLSSFFFLFFMLLFYIFNNFFILITFILFYFTLLYFLPPLLPLSLPSLVVADRV